MSWNPSTGSAPSNFVSALYENDSEEVDEGGMAEELEVDEDDFLEDIEVQEIDYNIFDMAVVLEDLVIEQPIIPSREQSDHEENSGRRSERMDLVIEQPTSPSREQSDHEEDSDRRSERMDDEWMPEIERDREWVPESAYEYEMRESTRGRAQGRARAVRGRGRGRGRRVGRGRSFGSTHTVRGGRRGRGSRGGAASTSEYLWTRGDPLVQVCATDDSVPPLLQSMAADLTRTREASETLVRERRERQLARERESMADDRNDRQNEEEDEFYEGDDGGDMNLIDGAERFEWCGMESFESVKETFVPEQTGSVTPRLTMYDAFRSYWVDGILQEIVTETNRYALGIESNIFRREWYPTNIHEILILFAFWMMLSIVKMPTIKSCFSLNTLLKTTVFRQMFTAKRYDALCRALHFCNNDARPSNASRMYLMGTILDHLNRKFKANYIPSQNISIDESLTLWKGLLLFKQYISSKVARYGIKTFELCESNTGYLWSFVVYTGKGSIDDENTPSSVLKSTSLVIKLLRPLLGKGYTVYMDNWFNSPILARYLKKNKTDCVGTLRSTRRGIPPLIPLAQLRKGEFIARHCGDISLLAWQDKKKILTISTFHGAQISPVVIGRGNRHSTVWKPQVVLDYNKHMGGVDRKDQMLEPYLVERKRHMKWYMKLFKRLLNCSVLNSRILLESSTQSKVDHLACRLDLVEQIMNKHLTQIPVARIYHPTRNSEVVTIASFAHWPVFIGSGRGANPNQHMRKRCVMCYRRGLKMSRTTLKCESCDVPLCIECFKDFHVHM